MELTDCPACALPSTIRDRVVLESTSGPVEHVVIRCVRGHPFTMPNDLLERVNGPPRAERRRPAVAEQRPRRQGGSWR